MFIRILRIQAVFHFKVTQVMFPLLYLGGYCRYTQITAQHTEYQGWLFAPESFSTTITEISAVHRCAVYPEWSRETVLLVSHSRERYVST